MQPSARDGSDWIGPAVQRRHLVEHDDWIDHRYNVDLPLRAELAQVNLSPDENKHAGARLAFLKDRLPTHALPDIAGADDALQISPGKLAEMPDSFESFNQVGG